MSQALNSILAIGKKFVRGILGVCAVILDRVDRNPEIPPGEINKFVLDGFELLVNSPSLIPRFYSKHPLYSRQIQRLVLTVQKKYPDVRLIDVGANIGDTVALVKSVSQIPVVCIEGEAYCFNLLQKNLQQFKDVCAYNIFLGERTEMMPVSLEGQLWNATIVPNGSSGLTEVQLQFASLDDFIASNLLHAHYRILKIDVEGYDPKVIRGGTNYLKSISPILYFEYNRQAMDRISEDGLSLLCWLEELGYDAVLFYDSHGKFMLSSNLGDRKLLQQLHEYVDGSISCISYFDLIVFHRSDNDLATTFINSEEKFQRDWIAPS